MALSYIVLPVIVSLFLIRKYREYVWGFYKNDSSLKGQVFLVTGANSGVGKETVRQLAARQATVILACRNKQATQEAIEDIRRSTSNGELNYHDLDLSSLASVRKFASEINDKYSRIDVLINNAGVAVPLENDMKTAEGFEMNFGVNHLGHFLLTQLLLPKLVGSAPSRIVIVSSTLHERGNIDLEDLSLVKLRSSGQKFRFSPGYCNSKLANAYHARELAERVKDAEVDVCLVCPGFTYTNLFRYSSVKWWSYIVFSPIAFFFMRSALQGSQTIIYCATEENLAGKSGDFYRDVKPYESKAKFDVNIQKKLWQKSEELVKA